MTRNCFVNDLQVGGFKHDWIIFHFIYGITLPIDFHIFQCVFFNHQPVMIVDDFHGPKKIVWRQKLRWVGFLPLTTKKTRFCSNSY